jgi:hypothetical protein
MSNFDTEPKLTLRQAADLLRGGKKAQLSNRIKLGRWILKGVTVRGQRVKLEGVREGGQWLTSAEALKRFQERTTARAVETHQPQDRTPTQRQRASEKAMRDLKAAGWA